MNIYVGDAEVIINPMQHKCDSGVFVHGDACNFDLFFNNRIASCPNYNTKPVFLLVIMSNPS